MGLYQRSCNHFSRIWRYSFSIQLHSNWWSALSKYRYILCWGVFSHQTDTWIYRYCNLQTIRRFQSGKNIRLRIFGYYWYCYLQSWYQYLWLQLLQSGPQSTVFGLEGELTLSGSANESITPFIEPQGTDGNFRFLTGSAEIVRDSITRAVAPELLGDVYIGGTADIGFSPAVTGVGIATLRTGREEFQTYLRIIDPDMDLVLTTIGGGLINEDFVKSYNESSIYYGPQDEDYGSILSAACIWDGSQLLWYCI